MSNAKWLLMQHIAQAVKEKEKDLGEVSLEDASKLIKKRVVERDFDAVIAITGYEGMGKSTLAVWLGLLSNPNFDFDNQIIYTPDISELKEKYRKEKPGTIFIADEAIKIMYKLNWQSKLQRFINMLYTTSRDENKISLLCMPRFLDFSEYFRNHRIIMHFHVFARGYAVIFGKSKNPFSRDPWYLNYNESLVDALEIRMKPRRPEDWLNIFSKCKGYMGYVKFPDLEEDVKQKYLEVKSKYKFEGIEEDETMNRWEKLNAVITAKALNMLLEINGLTKTELAKRLGVSQGTVSEILTWLKYDDPKLFRSRNYVLNHQYNISNTNNNKQKAEILVKN